jgi:hypothetical protein
MNIFIHIKERNILIPIATLVPVTGHMIYSSKI